MAEKLSDRKRKKSTKAYKKAFRSKSEPRGKKRVEIRNWRSYPVDLLTDLCGWYPSSNVRTLDSMIDYELNTIIDQNATPGMRRPGRPDKIKPCRHIGYTYQKALPELKKVTHPDYGVTYSVGAAGDSWETPVATPVGMTSHPIVWEVGRISKIAYHIQPSISDFFKSDFNLVAFLVELQESLLIVHQGVALLKDYFKSQYVKSASSAILWNNFGAQPLASDICSIYERVLKGFEPLFKWNQMAANKTPIIVHRTVGGEGFHTDWAQYPRSLSDAPNGNILGEYTNRYYNGTLRIRPYSDCTGAYKQKLTCKFIPKWMSDDAYMYKLLGIDTFENVLAGVWEGVPFSWLIDYFVQVGDWLQTPIVLPYDYDSGCVSVKLNASAYAHEKASTPLQECSLAKAAGDLSEYLQGSAMAELSYYDRTLIPKSTYDAWIRDIDTRRCQISEIKVNEFSIRHFVNFLAVVANPLNVAFKSKKQIRDETKRALKKAEARRKKAERDRVNAYITQRIIRAASKKKANGVDGPLRQRRPSSK